MFQTIRIGDKVSYQGETVTVARINPDYDYCTVMRGPFAVFVSAPLSGVILLDAAGTPISHPDQGVLNLQAAAGRFNSDGIYMVDGE